MKQSHWTTPKHAIAVASALLAIVTAPATATSAEIDETPYVMAVVSNDAHGRRVTSGRYEQAIQRITHGGQRTRAKFADQNNLCVAYAKTVEMEKAVAACDSAVEQVRKRAKRAMRSTDPFGARKQAFKNDLSMALSNRGVLRAVVGQTDLARQDFVAAIELQSRVSYVAEKNLDRLEQGILRGK